MRCRLDRLASRCALVLGLVACKEQFDDYAKKSKRVEADLMLNRLAKRLKTYAVTNGKLPAGQVGPSPATACCGQPGNKCQPDPRIWEEPVWRELDFAIFDPHDFHFSYESDGKTFNATAVGDLDCDNVMMTYTMTGSLDERTGEVTTVIRAPATVE